MTRGNTELAIDPREAADLLRRWRAGDDDAFHRLYEMIYPTLRHKARLMRPERGTPTASLTDAVHGTFLKLLDARIETDIRTLDHFYGYWAVAFRNFVRQRCRRVGRRLQVSEDKAPERDAQRERNERTFTTLHEAMEELRRLDPEAAEAIDLKYTVGMTSQEIAAKTGCSEPTVTRRLNRGRRFLAAALAAGKI